MNRLIESCVLAVVFYLIFVLSSDSLKRDPE